MCLFGNSTEITVINKYSTLLSCAALRLVCLCFIFSMHSSLHIVYKVCNQTGTCFIAAAAAAAA
jgi:uncharacterized membrane protein